MPQTKECPTFTAELVNVIIAGNDQLGLAEITESFWARPLEPLIDATSFEVRNVLYHFPLIVGDRITATWNNSGKGGQGAWIVSGILDLMPGWYMRGQLPEDLTEAAQVFNELEESALELEAGYGAFFGHWSCDYSFDDLARILTKAHPSARFTMIFHELARRDWLDSYVAFGAVDGQAPVLSDYWAANDPKWRQLGLGSPSFLVHIQRLIRENPDLLQLIETRQYGKAIRWINKYDETYERLTSA